MYNFSAGDVPQSVTDSMIQLASVSDKSVSGITESILKYLTGVEGVNKEVMADAVTEFASVTSFEIGQAQAVVKVLLNILKASYRVGLTSAQVAEDFQKLTGSQEVTKPIVRLWSKYVHRSDTATGTVSTSADAKQSEAVPVSAVKAQPMPEDVGSAAEVRTETGPVTAAPDSDRPPAEAPLTSLDDVLEHSGLGALDQLQDIQWSFGVTAASSEPDRVGGTFVRLALHVRSPEGRPAVRRVQLTVSQFYSLLHQLEKARAVARFM